MKPQAVRKKEAEYDDKKAAKGEVEEGDQEYEETESEDSEGDEED